MPKLFDDEDVDAVAIKVNPTFASNYQHRKEKEQLTQLSSKYSRRDEETESSDSEEEDEDAELLTDEVEQGFLKALSLIKNNDPTIFKKETSFFSDAQLTQTKNSKPKKEKPLHIKDQIRNELLSKGAEAGLSSEDDADEDHPKVRQSKEKLTYDEEQRQLRQSFLKSFEDGSEDEGEGGLLVVRQKNDDEAADEEAKYERWLQGQAKLDASTASQLEPLREFWTNPNLNENDKFLRDYITKQLWKPRDASNYKVPLDPAVSDSEDEEAVEEQERFEKQFNFRFEEEEGTQIKAYPRAIETSLRRDESKRKEQREAKKLRKKEEKLRKKEEINRLKSLKKKEVLDRLKKIQEITGASIDGLEKLDLEGEFKPEEFDQQMAEAFDDDYYEGEEEPVKPVFEHDDYIDDEEFDDDDEEGDEEGDGDQWDDAAAEHEAYDENFIMDADYAPEPEQEVENKKDKKKKKKSKSEQESEDLGEEAKETLDSFLEQSYALDFDDIAGGMPTRFRYRQVASNDFGLTAEELLFGEERQLRKWAPVRKIVKYLTPDEEKKEIKKYHSKSISQKKAAFITPPEVLLQREKERQEARQEKSAVKVKKQKKNKKNKECKKQASESIDEAESGHRSKRLKIEEEQTASEHAPTQNQASHKDKAASTDDASSAAATLSASRLAAYHSGKSGNKHKPLKK